MNGTRIDDINYPITAIVFGRNGIIKGNRSLIELIRLGGDQ